MPYDTHVIKGEPMGNYYYDTKNDETIFIEDGCATVYDNEGYATSVIKLNGGDSMEVMDMMDHSERYVSFDVAPLTLTA